MKRYTNKEISTRWVKTGERALYDYGVSIKEIGADVKHYHISLNKRDKRTRLWIYQGAYRGPNDFSTLAQAKKKQKELLNYFKSGVAFEVVNQ